MEKRIPDLAFGAVHVDEWTVKRSRFIVTMARVRNPEEAKAFIDRIRAQYSDATHNCWAYVAGEAGSSSQVGASDDGEPKGTAGRPMLTQLLHSGVGEVAAVVTRYFGGTLLGTGGLVRAYQGSVKLGLEHLPTRVVSDRKRVLISVDIIHSDAIQGLLKTIDHDVVSSDFSFDAAFEILMNEEDLPMLEERVASLTQGEGLVEALEAL